MRLLRVTKVRVLILGRKRAPSGLLEISIETFNVLVFACPLVGALEECHRDLGAAERNQTECLVRVGVKVQRQVALAF